MKTFWEHFNDLKRYILLGFGFVIAGAILTHYYHKELIAYLFSPLGTETPLQFLSPLDPLIFIIKIDLYGGLVLSFPFLLFLGWLFISPALPGKRLRSLLIAFFSLLLLGAALTYTYLLILPTVLNFLTHNITVPGTEIALAAPAYLDFIITTSLLMMGVSQIPLAIIVLTLVGLLNPYILSNKRGHVYVGIIIILSFLTPTTDLISLALILIPCLIILEVGTIIAKFIYRNKNKKYESS